MRYSAKKVNIHRQKVFGREIIQQIRSKYEHKFAFYIFYAHVDIVFRFYLPMPFVFPA